MFQSNFSRVVLLNFITAFIITFVACYFLKTFNLSDVMHIGSIFGLYFLTVYGIDILVGSEDVKNNYQRFLLAIALIIIFDAVFLILTPLIFGCDFSALSDYLIIIFDGIRFDVKFNIWFYMALFAVLMLIFNFLLYMKDRKIHNDD